MAIYRGPGGSGDATADSANTAHVAEAFATQAGVSAANAADSATNAGTSASAASTSATNAAASASAAATSASNAATSATNAANAAINATTAETNAADSENAAAASEAAAEGFKDDAETAKVAAEAAQAAAETAQANAETAETGALAAQSAAESARDAALAAYDNFDDRYLGAKSSDPALDNDGNALLTGALYFNTVAGEMKLYTGTAWVSAYVSGSGFLAAANNLSDLTNTTTARQNLDLEIGVDVQAYDADTAKYDDTVANFSGTLQNNSHTVLTTASDYLDSTDIGATVQGYDADTVKYDDVNPSFTDTGAIKVPVGTELQRPGTPAAGQLRFNNDSDEFEGYNGTEWGALGGSGGSSSFFTTFEYVATAGQTTFSGLDANSQSLAYTAGAIVVSLNGVRLRPGNDYTASNGTSIVLTSAASLDDELIVDAYSSFNVANTYTQAQADGLFASTGKAIAMAIVFG